MRVTQFEFNTVSNHIYVCGSADAVYISSDPHLLADIDHFYQIYRNDLIILYTIGDHVAPLQIDIRLNEAAPPENTVLLATQFPFRIKGDDVMFPLEEDDREISSHNEDALPESDRTVLILLYCEDSNVANIPPGNYVLTIHQFYSGEKPLGLPEDPSAIPLEERWKWDEVPTCLNMYFNSVDSLDGIEAKEHWNWPDANNW